MLRSTGHCLSAIRGKAAMEKRTTAMAAVDKNAERGIIFPFDEPECKMQLSVTDFAEVMNSQPSIAVREESGRLVNLSKTVSEDAEIEQLEIEKTWDCQASDEDSISNTAPQFAWGALLENNFDLFCEAFTARIADHFISMTKLDPRIMTFINVDFIDIVEEGVEALADDKLTSLKPKEQLSPDDISLVKYTTKSVIKKMIRVLLTKSSTVAIDVRKNLEKGAESAEHGYRSRFQFSWQDENPQLNTYEVVASLIILEAAIRDIKIDITDSDLELHDKFFTLQTITGDLRLYTSKDGVAEKIHEYLLVLLDRNHKKKDSFLIATGYQLHSETLNHSLALVKMLNMEYDKLIQESSTDNSTESKIMTRVILAVKRIHLESRGRVDNYVSTKGFIQQTMKLLRSSKNIEEPELNCSSIEKYISAEEEIYSFLKPAAFLLDVLLHTSFNGMKYIATCTKTTSFSRSTLSKSYIRVDAGLAKMSTNQVSILSDYPPMIAPPLSWNTGSPYYKLKAKLLRFDRKGKWLDRLIRDNCSSTFPTSKLVKGLDFLNSVKWKISLEAIRHLKWMRREGMESGDKLKGGYVLIPQSNPRARSKKAHRIWMEHNRSIKVKNSDRSASNKQANQLLKLTDKLHNRSFHLPVNCDFRGRIYPMHTALNYQASDFVRSMLVFGEEKPLGKNGLFHLKIHAANLMGLDKKSFDERIAWIDENVEGIIHSAENPKAPDALWRAADKPLLGHVVLTELGRALSHSRGPAFYETATPIHVDGSCNGLQHYSALALDPSGAATSNLVKKKFSERPSDVYTSVLEVVIKKNNEILEQGSSHPNYDKAVMVDGNLVRKTIKQSVMTNVYGVTAMGMRRQILSQLEAQNENLVVPFGSYELKSMAAHVASLVNESLKDVFKGAVQTQAWFKVSFDLVYSQTNSSVFLSPLNKITQKQDAIKTIRIIHNETHIKGPPVCFMSQVCVFYYYSNLIFNCESV